MFKFIKNIIPALFFWGLFIYVVLQVPYPETITQANILQVLSFFLPLFFALAFTLNTIFKNMFISFSISLGLVFALVLKALDSLNIVTGVLIIISIGLLVSYFRKRKKKSLTKLPKIHKLTKLRNQ